ncbi:MAG: helix-turn-helix transcriptional regulator [Peptostreptococcaceae bacterium]|nr:helix-turn-helix transcriptional regulator [Peptostreptococcaceae bacterium]
MNNFNLLRSPADLNKDIANRMRARRKEKKLSQAELSARSDVSLGSLKRFESIGEISLSSLIKIAFALGCEDDLDHLFAKKKYTSIREVIDEKA